MPRASAGRPSEAEAAPARELCLGGSRGRPAPEGPKLFCGSLRWLVASDDRSQCPHIATFLHLLVAARIVLQRCLPSGVFEKSPAPRA
eukprot:5813873-Alexandrium_andersonii.AAC.1